jgi:hypothetical protein
MFTSWMMPGCRRLHSSKIAASRTVVSMLCSSSVWTPSAKMIGLDLGLAHGHAVTWKVGAL